MSDFSQLSLAANIALFAAAAVVIALAGTRLAGTADRLADRTGLGEAMTGALMLGASTSIPGIVTSVTAAAENAPELSVSNAIGGIAAQTVFLAIADISYRKVNLEHAAASAENIMQAALLMVLLAFPLVAMSMPPVTVLNIHPVSFLMIGGYAYGMRKVAEAKAQPMWRPHMTSDTKTDIPNRGHTRELLARLWLLFGLFACILGFAGWVVGEAGVAISSMTGLSQVSVGAIFTAVSTSLPELVTSIAAVRRGALTLAVSNIIGGNAFDTLFVAVSDVWYQNGSIYHAVTEYQVFLISLSMIMTGVLVMGLVRRERRGPGNIGFESVLLLFFYTAAIGFLITGG